jgi:hypothetical protein
MDVAGSAVGIASLGIQICQGLLSYYDAWKSFNSDISSTYQSIDDLSRTLISLKASLSNDDLDQEKKDRVKSCIHLCEGSLGKLSQKSQKLRKSGQPEGFRQNAWAELQRTWYPFRASTLAKLREIVAEAREQLKLAVQELQLDVSATSQRILRSVASVTTSIDQRTGAIATSVAHISAQTQQILNLQQSDQFNKIKAWLCASDPWTNHSAARQQHEPHTGVWLLKSDQYRRWKAGDYNYLWLYGKAGCGKTVLCSTVIEDIKAYCDQNSDALYGVFYFTFSDRQKQSYENLIRSLVAQLGWKEPGLSALVQACEKPNASIPGVDELEKILVACIQTYRVAFLMVDALDESPEDYGLRQIMLEGLGRLIHKASNIKMLMTSRELVDVQDSMLTLGAKPVSIAVRPVNMDIQKYVSNQLLRDRKLNNLDATTKALIEDTISRRADGM